MDDVIDEFLNKMIQLFYKLLSRKCKNLRRLYLKIRSKRIRQIITKEVKFEVENLKI